MAHDIADRRVGERSDRPHLQASGRTTAVLGVLALLFVVAIAWGTHEVSKPFPGKQAAAPICEDVPVAAGQTIRPHEVLVNVLNGSDRSGLARTTRTTLTKFGFAPGELGDTTASLHGARAAVWTDDPKAPDALMVASYLGRGVRIVRKDAGYVGLTVVVGDSFNRVHRGMASIRVASDTSVCEPTTAADGIG